MANVDVVENDELLDIAYFTNKNEEVPFWDHPLFYASKDIRGIKNYYPYDKLAEVLGAAKIGFVDDLDLTLLKVLGDSISCNEDQLRRYMTSQMSRSQVSKRLNKLRRNDYVHRWKSGIKGDKQEKNKPPAPFTLGVAGVKWLNHYYNEQFFMEADSWDSLGSGAIQRYVAVNELRCRLIEAKASKNWVWSPIIANNKQIRKPMGVSEIKTPKGNLNFFIERPQMSQDFIGFLKDKLHGWKKVYEKYGTLPLNDVPDNVPTVVLFASTVSIADVLHSNLLLDTFPFTVWVCVEEDMLQDGLETAFYIPVNEELKRVRLDFLARKEQEGETNAKTTAE